MAKIAGRLATFAVDPAAGSSYTAVNGIVDASLNTTTEELDTTTHDSGVFREYITGRVSATLDLSLKWDEADTGQGYLATNAITPAAMTCRFRMNTGSGLLQFTGGCFVTSWAPSGANDDAASISCTVRLTGTITKATQ